MVGREKVSLRDRVMEGWMSIRCWLIECRRDALSRWAVESRFGTSRRVARVRAVVATETEGGQEGSVYSVTCLLAVEVCLRGGKRSASRPASRLKK